MTMAIIRLVIALIVLVMSARSGFAQDDRVYIGAAFALVTQTHSTEEPLGGTTRGGNVLFGVRVSERVAIEVEPSFNGVYSWQYSYRPSPSLIADVMASRRDTFVPIQVRFCPGILEPVFGAGFVRSKISRHAVIGNATYFDDGRTDQHVALVGGLDAALKLAPHFYVVPTFRMLFSPREKTEPFNDPLGEQTTTGSVLFRYGAGARVTF